VSDFADLSLTDRRPPSSDADRYWTVVYCDCDGNVCILHARCCVVDISYVTVILLLYSLNVSDSLAAVVGICLQAIEVAKGLRSTFLPRIIAIYTRTNMYTKRHNITSRTSLFGYCSVLTCKVGFLGAVLAGFPFWRHQLPMGLSANPWELVTPALIKLHWLSIEARVQYKLCLLVHLTTTGKAPDYILNLLQPVSGLSSRHTVLRSASNEQLFIPHTRLKFGERAFSVSGESMEQSSCRHSLHHQHYFLQKETETFLFSKAFQLPSPM